jgi:hypothetical protein
LERKDEEAEERYQQMKKKEAEEKQDALEKAEGKDPPSHKSNTKKGEAKNTRQPTLVSPRKDHEKNEKDKVAPKVRDNNLAGVDAIVIVNLENDIIKHPIEECTPLASIPGILSLTFEGLGFEGAVVIIDDYYYNHKT